MKNPKFMLAAVILTATLALTGCQDAVKMPHEDSFVNNIALQTGDLSESSESKIFLAAAAPNISEVLPMSNQAVTSDLTDVSITPQGNCSYCNGTGHHNNEICGNCNGSGFCDTQTAPQGNCPYCDGTGHHNNEICGNCNGSGFCDTQTAPQGNCSYCNGTGHHNNEICGNCNGTGFCNTQTVPQGNCPYCNGTGLHNNGICGNCSGTGFCNTQTTPQVPSGGCHSHNRYQSNGHHGSRHHCH